MTRDLSYLVWAVGLTIVQLLAAIIGATMQFPIPQLVGNRETALEGRGWVGRAQRAHRNMLESLVLFAALVLVAHAAGRSNSMTIQGAAVFFYSRVAYALVYWFGITWLRSIVFFVSMLGLLLILWQLL